MLRVYDEFLRFRARAAASGVGIGVMRPRAGSENNSTDVANRRPNRRYFREMFANEIPGRNVAELVGRQ